LQIPGAYRSLSRPSSPLRAKASPVYPFLLSSTYTAFAQYSMPLFIKDRRLLDARVKIQEPRQILIPDALFLLPSNNVPTVVFSFLITSSNMSKNGFC
jgi:hypothetical protein